MNQLDWYYRKHQVCPECGSPQIMDITNDPLLMRENPEYRDTNRCLCKKCDWRGTIQQLTMCCKINPVSEHICKFGTKGCVVTHGGKIKEQL